MNLYEEVKTLSVNRKISIHSLEEKLNYGNGTVSR